MHFRGSKIPVFIICLKKFFWAQQNLRTTPPVAAGLDIHNQVTFSIVLDLSEVLHGSGEIKCCTNELPMFVLPGQQIPNSVSKTLTAA